MRDDIINIAGFSKKDVIINDLEDEINRLTKENKELTKQLSIAVVVKQSVLLL